MNRLSRRKYFVVVAYDISDDKRRRKISEVLKDYGVRVQYSVFECMLDYKRLKEMEKRVVRRMNKDEDRLRIYVLLEICRKRVIVHGVGGVIEDEGVILV